MQVLNIFHVLVAIGLIVFVLIQRGQGATAGAAFGSGASGTVFGARGAGNFLSRSTWVLAALFCAISLTMAVLVSRMMTSDEPDLGVMGATQQQPVIEEVVPVEPSVGPDEPSAIDVPAFEPTTESGDGAVSAVEADDLPPAGEAVEAVEPNQVPAGENGEDSG